MMRACVLVLALVGAAVGQLVQTGTLEAVVQQLSASVDELQAQVQELQSKVDSQGGNMGGSGGSTPTVAFMAQYSAENAVGVDQGAYVFDNAILNIGNGYDTNTGKFTAPVSGVYIIAVQLFTDGGDKEHPFADIKLNGDTLARLAFEENNGQEDSDSTTVTVQLQAGDEVWIQSEEGQAYHYWGGFHTFFTGTLVAANNAPDNLVEATTQYPVTF